MAGAHNATAAGRRPVAGSLDLLDALHRRWVSLLRSLSRTQLQREFAHPESGPATPAVTVGSYAWHGRHHLAHIERSVEREGWRAAAGCESRQVV